MKYRDDFKIRFTRKPEFTIDEKNKTVKCYLTGDVIVPNGLTGNKFMENFRAFAKGYAKCDDKDKFNPEIGKRIALARAENRLYWKVRTEVKAAIRDAKKFIEGGEKFVAKAYGVIGHNDMYVSQYCPVKNKKKTTSEILSEKAKAQTRDEKGRFTACTKTENCCNATNSKNDKNNEKQGYDKKCYNNNKCKDNTGAIRIIINRI